MKTFKIITAFLLLFISFSCQNDDDNALNNNNSNTNTDAFTENFGNEINRTFLGKVIDKNNNPIENVTITIGSAIAQTDSNGIFIISDATVHEHFGYVKAEKAGYIHGSRAVVPSTGTNKVTIMLLEETVGGTTNSGTVETISLPNGASVALEGEYIKEDGSAYSGNVNVIMHFLDPADENMINQMPGMLYAANTQNEERMLQTFGMLAVELRGPSGEDLNLAEGSSAEIKVPVDATLLANAPATIPLWYFDEDAGYWKEDGFATLVGNAYVGTVTHFSFWNCDIPVDAINLCITVTDENGNPLANLWVKIISNQYGSRGGFTNENGEVCGLVPSNETLEVNINSGDSCGSTSIYNSNIGPFSIDDSISITIPSNFEIVSETVIGSFNTCDGNPVTEGYVTLSYGGQTFTDIVNDGSFEINLIHCTNNNTFSIQGRDYTNLQATDSINYTFTTPITNLGSLNACNDVTEFITYQVDTEDSVQEYFGIVGDVYEYDLATYYDNTAFGGFQFSLLVSDLNNPVEVGTYNFQNTYLNFSNENHATNPNGELVNITINVSAIGNVGEYIDINFTGTFEDMVDMNTHTISGTIHVLRDY